MLKHAFFAAVFASAISTAALAWSETSVDLVDPSGQSVKGGVLRSEIMAGYFCADRPYAETLSQYMSGNKIPSKALTIALVQCEADIRAIVGIFPQHAKFPVVFVRRLDNLAESDYFVPEMLIDRDKGVQ